MADIVDTEVEISVQSALIEFNREELEMLHNVMGRVQLARTGYGNAAFNILTVLDDIFGEIEQTDHLVEMVTVGGHSLYWSQPSDSGLHWDEV